MEFYLAVLFLMVVFVFVAAPIIGSGLLDNGYNSYLDSLKTGAVFFLVIFGVGGFIFGFIWSAYTILCHFIGC